MSRFGRAALLDELRREDIPAEELLTAGMATPARRPPTWWACSVPAGSSTQPPSRRLFTARTVSAWFPPTRAASSRSGTLFLVNRWRS